MKSRLKKLIIITNFFFKKHLYDYFQINNNQGLIHCD